MKKNDITNQQLLDALTQQLGVITDNMATKDDIARLERRIKSTHTVNIQHHLATKGAIGDLHQELTKLRQGLAQAARL